MELVSYVGHTECTSGLQAVHGLRTPVLDDCTRDFILFPATRRIIKEEINSAVQRLSTPVDIVR
jgi:hypothetical protein